MNVGALAAIAAINPGNLAILCVDNGHYGETGWQKSHTSLGVDLEKMASGAGIKRTMTAARRRLHEELGVDSPLAFAFFARYRAGLDHGMTENEFVYVYFGPLAGRPKPDPAEVAEVAFASPAEISRRIKREPDSFAYWLKHYFHHHYPEIARLARR